MTEEIAIANVGTHTFEDPFQAFTLIEESEYKGSTARKKNALVATEDAGMACECRYIVNAPRPQSQACGPDSDCINRLLLVECGSDCPAGRHCLNRRFSRKQYADVSVRATPGKGHGLFANIALPAGHFIMEYVGEVLSYASFVKRSRRYSAQGASHFYFMTLTQDEIIDASTKGNISRFMNHSCNPNSSTQKWIVDGSMRIGLFTTRDIPAGAELTFDYKFESFDSEPQTCRCGEPHCKGYIGTSRSRSPEEMDENDALLEDGTFEFSDESEAEEGADGLRHRKRIRKASSHRKPRGLVHPEDMPGVIQSILQSESVDALQRCLGILRATDDHVCLRRFLYLHGLPILHGVLAQHLEHKDVVRQILRFLRQLPILTRNSVQDSKLEPLVVSLMANAEQPERTKAIAREIVEKWSSLEVVFKIPKTRQEQLREEQTSMSSLARDLYSETTGRLTSQKDAPVRLVAVTHGSAKPASPESEKSSGIASPSSVDQVLVTTPDGRQLPPNWSYTYDETSGAIFYYNALSQSTQWDFPADDAPAAPLGTAVTFKPDESQVAEALQLARERMQSTQVAKQAEHEAAVALKEQHSRLKEAISNLTIRWLSKFKQQMSHDEFKRLARKLTHALLEKDLRIRESRSPSPTAMLTADPVALDDKTRKKMKLYMKDYLGKLGYKKPDKPSHSSAAGGDDDDDED